MLVWVVEIQTDSVFYEHFWFLNLFRIVTKYRLLTEFESLFIDKHIDVKLRQQFFLLQLIPGGRSQYFISFSSRPATDFNVLFRYYTSFPIDNICFHVHLI